MLDVIVQVLTAWFIADFGSGLVHWWEDRYGNPDWPWPWGEHVVKPNIEHHYDQLKITRSNYFARNCTTLIASAPFVVVAIYFKWWAVAVGFLWLSQANEIHTWSHQRCSLPIRLLQEAGLLLNPRSHAVHHKRPFDKNYCACTDYLNPILTAIEFWPRLERIIAMLTGIRPRRERAVF